MSWGLNSGLVAGLVLMAAGSAVAAAPSAAAGAAVSGLCQFASSPTLFTTVQCEPQFTASVGKIGLYRSRPSSAVVMTPPTGTPGTVFDADQFTFGWATGTEVNAGIRGKSGWGVEGRYFTTPADVSTSPGIDVTTFRTAGIGVTVLGGGTIDPSDTS